MQNNKNENPYKKFLFEKPYLNKNTSENATKTLREPEANETTKRRANEIILNFVLTLPKNNAANAIVVNEENILGFQITPLYLPEKINGSIINPNIIYLEGFKNHSDIILPLCMLNVIHNTDEEGMIVKDKIFIDSSEMINYDFSKDEQVYIMLQCNDFEGEYSTSINLEYTV